MDTLEHRKIENQTGLLTLSAFRVMYVNTYLFRQSVRNGWTKQYLCHDNVIPMAIGTHISKWIWMHLGNI